MKPIYVFTHWEKKDVQTTSSDPGAPYTLPNPYVKHEAPGRRALQLLEQGYFPVGYYILGSKIKKFAV